MPNQLHLTCENPDEILNTGAYGAGALIRLQTSATEAGAYADVSGTGSTPTTTVVTLTRAYTAYDPNGTSTSWYRTRYENVGGTRLSDWSAVFQVAGEEAGYICSLYDVRQRLGMTDPTNTSSDEDLLDYIRSVTVEIETYTGRDFTGYQSDTTWQTHSMYGRILNIPRGIQSVTTLAVATSDQPATGGTYTTVSSSLYFVDPPSLERDPYWPGTRIVMLIGATFYTATFGVQITGKPGFASVPPNIARIGASAVVSQFLTKGAEGPRAVIGPDGRTVVLRDISPADWTTLDSYRTQAVS